MNSRAPGYGGEAAAIRGGAALLLAAEYGAQGDGLSLVLPGTRVTSARGPVPGRPFVPAHVVTDPDSELRPACEDEDPEIFFPPPGDVQMTNYGRAVCRRCPFPVRERCLVLGDRETSGTWGGVTEQDRTIEQRRNFRRASVRRLQEIQQSRREA